MKIKATSKSLSQFNGLSKALAKIDKHARQYEKMFPVSESLDKLLEPYDSSVFLGEAARVFNEGGFNHVKAMLGGADHLTIGSIIGDVDLEKLASPISTITGSLNSFELQSSLISSNILNIPDSVKSLLSSPILDGVANLGISNEFADIVGRLNSGLIYHGEFDFDEDDFSVDYKEDDGSSEIDIALAEEFQEQLEIVQFVPFKLLQKIKQDPSLMRHVSPRDFERFVAELIDKLGFQNVVLTPQSNDGGRDIIATKYENGYPVIFAFECKRYAPHRKIGLDFMRALLGVITHRPTSANRGVLVTTSSFTKGSNEFIAAEPSIDGQDFNNLVKLLQQISQ